MLHSQTVNNIRQNGIRFKSLTLFILYEQFYTITSLKLGEKLKIQCLMIQCLLARHDVSATTTCSFLKVGYGGLSMRSILTGNNLGYQHKYASKR